MPLQQNYLKKHNIRKLDYERVLNEMEIPPDDLKSNGGRISDHTKNYGTWMRLNDPIAFNVGYNEWRQDIERRIKK